jgi:beta-galactosidase/beta-glucuronidase
MIMASPGESGKSRFADAMQLPGTTALAGKGAPLNIPINLERPAMQSLQQRFRYVGPAWYQRTIRVASDWKNQDVILTLERVIWESRVWVNGQEVGPAKLSLATPHRHEVTRFLKPGAENIITIRIDNREKVPVGVMGHSYTDETQTIWNGIVGRIALEAKPKLRIESLKLRPNLASNGVTATVSFVNNSGNRKKRRSR